MSDDWRVELDIEEHGGLHRLAERRHERSVAREARDRLGDDVVITVDDDRMYAYAQTEARAREAEQRLQELAAEHGLQARATVARWHPEEQRWEPLDAPLPRTPAEHEAERETLEAEQRGEAAERGYAEWEVRIELRDHNAATALAERLKSEGLTVVSRGEVVVIAAATEDDANALAERMRTEAPDAVRVTAEGSAAVAMDALNPFTVITGRWRRT
jgi:hypothetical protein